MGHKFFACQTCLLSKCTHDPTYRTTSSLICYPMLICYNNVGLNGAGLTETHNTQCSTFTLEAFCLRLLGVGGGGAVAARWWRGGAGEAE